MQWSPEFQDLFEQVGGRVEDGKAYATSGVVRQQKRSPVSPYVSIKMHSPLLNYETLDAGMRIRSKSIGQICVIENGFRFYLLTDEGQVLLKAHPQNGPAETRFLQPEEISELSQQVESITPQMSESESSVVYSAVVAEF